VPVLLRRQLANRLEELRLIERRQHGLHGPGMVERVVDRGAHVGVVDRVEGRARHRSTRAAGSRRSGEPLVQRLRQGAEALSVECDHRDVRIGVEHAEVSPCAATTARAVSRASAPIEM
jgi:NAD(P)-dependent dehydrogenase (short-subunit alcohol dehydrogenase family)